MPVRRAFAAHVRRHWPALAPLLALLAVAASPAAVEAGEIAPAPAPGAVLAQLVQDVGGRGAAQTPQRYAYLKKIDSHLQDVAAGRLGTGSPAGARLAAARQGVTTSPQGDVAVDVYVNGDVAEAADALRGLGMRVLAVGDRPPQRLVEGLLPPAALPAAAALPATRAIVAPFSSLASVTSEGDAAIHGPQARALGPQGAGVSVGVISDSIDEYGGGIADSQASGDLPGNVVDLGDLPGGTDEGRAMAEIVYDEAPGISGIVFVTAAGGPQAKANSIDSLVSHGVKVIADDTSYVTEPFFQDGVVSQAVDRAKAAGVGYFISAGNDGSQSWEGTYNGGATQDFDPGPAVDTVQTVGTVDAGHPVLLVLQWAQPWNGATTDFAVDVYSISGGVPSYAYTVNTDNITSRLPEEAVSVSATSGTVTFGIAIRRVAGSGNPLLKYIDFTNGAGSVGIEHPTDSGAIGPDAASARGALTVAASPYATPTSPEPFSSRGPVVRRFDANGSLLAAPDVRHKPDLAAPDGVTTSVTPDFAPFYGTSAAAPAAAGIAALLLSAKPGMSVDELYAIMTNPLNALDCPAAGNPDVDCGAGFLLADRALAMALDSTAPVITPVVSPAAPDGPAGWYRVPVTVSWDVSDPDSPIVNPVGCGAAAPGDGDGQIICSATSAGGTTSVGVSVKRDSTPPSAPLIGGITPKTYLTTTLPPAASIICVATDPTSGITACTVTGYSAAGGAHTLTATATNGAGLVATTTVGYTVAKPAAIAQLALAKGITLGKLAKSGIPVTVRVATASTALVVKLVARVPKATGKGTRVIVLGTLTRRVPAGTAHLKITLTAKAKRQLRGVAKATLKVTVLATSAGAQKKLLAASLIVRRSA